MVGRALHMLAAGHLCNRCIAGLAHRTPRQPLRALVPAPRPRFDLRSQLTVSVQCFATKTTYSSPAMPQTLPVGQWQSPISSELITGKSTGLGGTKAGPDGLIYWLEGRPTEGGRMVLVRRNASGKIEDITPSHTSGSWNVRTTVHEYGGAPYALSKSHVYFANFKDQVVYEQSLGSTPGEPRAVNSADAKQRYADGVVDEPRGRLVAVREDHSGSGEAVNTVSSLDLKTGKSTVLAEGYDFYAAPRLSADGSQLAFVAWNHPNMPWDDTELFVAGVKSDGLLDKPSKVAGGKDESVMQPVWLPNGRLIFISDRGSGFWNLYEHVPGGSPRAVCPMKTEFGGPAWVFGGSHYAALPDGKLLASYSDPEEAGGKLAIIDVASGKLTPVKTPYSLHGGISVHSGKLATVGGSPTKPSEVAVLDVASGSWESLKTSLNLELDQGFLSAPQVVEFPTEGGKTAFMNVYYPKNKDYSLPEGQLPPLLIKIHGGPTSQCSTAFSLGYQFWTSRGYALADVNYGGSTGYGREYRNRLRGNWGVVDVDDCCNAAKHLAKEGKVDPKRLCITGGSAGGYTTLAALAFRNVFSAGTSHYGVADCGLLAADTHKFESPYPEAKKTYDERSAINYMDKFSAPCMFFQGDEDKVVPPKQAELMYEGLKERGITTGLVMFKGEQHGFRGANAIRRALEGELYFYGQVLGFDAAMSPDLETFEIVNLHRK